MHCCFYDADCRVGQINFPRDLLAIAAVLLNPPSNANCVDAVGVVLHVGDALSNPVKELEVPSSEGFRYPLVCHWDCVVADILLILLADLAHSKCGIPGHSCPISNDWNK